MRYRVRTINPPSELALDTVGGSETLADTTRSEVQFDNCMIKQDIVDAVVNRTGLSTTKAEIAVEAVLETMKRSMERGERIELRGFGVFSIRPRKTGIGRNPKTGEEVRIPPGKAIRFKPGKNLQSISVRRSPSQPSQVRR